MDVGDIALNTLPSLNDSLSRSGDRRVVRPLKLAPSIQSFS